MSVWKSPVLYFGIALLFVVSALVAAPYVLDWNAYKPGLESYGKRLTGRDVHIGGDVEIRLFPWPRLTAENVSIASPEGFGDSGFVDTDVLTLSLQLGSLLNGQLNVESVELLEPRITLARNSKGEVNWLLHPDQDLRRSSLLANVRLDQIQLLNATIRYDDQLKGLATAITTFDADMSAAAIEGPWKVKGSGSWNDMPLGITLTTSPYKDGEPLRFGVRFTPGDSAYPTFTVDGGYRDGTFEGTTSAGPQEDEGQKGSAEGGLKPLAFKAKLKLDAQAADFSDIHIAPSDTRDSATLIEGTAHFDLTETLAGSVKLKSPRMNLDTLLGAESMDAWRSGGVLALAHSLLRNVPAQMNASFALDVSVLTAGGDTLNGVAVAAHVAPEGIHIDNLRADLPGRSAVKLVDGLVARNDGAVALKGTLAFESNDTRAFAGWAMPDRKPAIDAWWKGSRGHLKFQSALDWTEARLQLSAMDYELEGLPGKADVALRTGATPSLDMRVETKSLDLSSFFPAAGSKGVGAQLFGVLGLLDPLLHGGGAMEKHLTLDAGSVTLNGVEAQDVAFDVAAGQSGFEIRAFDIGSVGGARVTADGLILSRDGAPSGEVKASIVADDPRGALRLLGLATSQAAWPRQLGQTDVKLDVMAKPDANGPVLAYTVSGTAQPFTLGFRGEVTELERGSDARLSLDGTIESQDGARLLALAGFAPATTGPPGKASLSLTGSKSGGFATKLNVEGFGVRATYDGSLKPEEPWSAPSGAVSVFATDMGPVMRAFGAPVAEGPNGALRLAFQVAPDNDGLKITDVIGDQAGLAMSGGGGISADGKLALDVTVGEISLTRILALALLPWDGSGASLSQPFATAKNLLMPGEIWLRPQKLLLPLAPPAGETAVGIILGTKRGVQVLAPTHPELELNLAVTDQGSVSDVNVSGKMALDLAQAFAMADGTPALVGTLKLSGNGNAQGRSPAAVLAELKGQGTYEVNGLSFGKLAPEEFAKGLPSATSAEALKALFASLTASAGLNADVAAGTFVVGGGQATLSPIRITQANSLSVVTGSADLVANEVTAAVDVTANQPPDLPPVSVIYAGGPGQVLASSKTSALALKLGHEILARDMEELERLKSEQEKMALAEEQQQKEDVAKFEAYQAQRAEIRLRQRELKVFAATRAARDAAAVAAFAAFVPQGDAMNKLDLARQKLALSVKPRLAAWAAENEQKRLAEEQRKQEEADKARRAEEARQKKLAEDAAKAEAQRQKAIADEEARLKAEAEAKALAEQKAVAEAEKKRQEEEALKKLEPLPQLPQSPPAAPQPGASSAPVPKDCANPLYC